LTRRDGIRVQVGYLPGLDVPDGVLVADTHTNDVRGLDHLILEDPTRLASLAGQTLVVDLGYYSHRRFAQMLDAQVHLITRLQPQASYQVDADLPVQARLTGTPAGRIHVQRDQRMVLGSPNNRAGAVLPGMRLVTAEVVPTPEAKRRGATTVVYRLVTDRWDLTADEIVACYLFRWHIELFFRWIKRSIHLIRLLGHSRQAVEASVWIAVIVHLLCAMAAPILGVVRRTPGLLLQLFVLLVQLAPHDLREDGSLPHQLPLFPTLLPPAPT
jgi:Transposase DDE domain